LRTEVARARELRAGAATALAQRRASERQQRSEQRQLALLEVQQRRRSAALAGTARLEGERATALGESARNLEELVGKLGAEGSLRDRLASLPGPLPRPAQLTESLPPANAVPEAAPIAFRLPVLGPIARGFGEALPSGARSRGVEIAARPGAIVVAPAAGQVTFAGLYRGYGAIAIIDHGGGYVSLVTGLGSNLARVGDRVDAGSPLGRAGTSGIGIELRKAGQPIDLTTLIG
jgi:septal ring factor EnvC (AmiA/AmiB activator)